MNSVDKQRKELDQKIDSLKTDIRVSDESTRKTLVNKIKNKIIIKMYSNSINESFSTKYNMKILL